MPVNKNPSQWTAQDAGDYLAGLVKADLGEFDSQTAGIVFGAAQTEFASRHVQSVGLGSPYDINYRLCELRDHWQRGLLWVGPRGSADVESMVLARVRPMFVPDDAVGEGLRNVANGLTEREATIEAVSLTEPEAPETPVPDPVPPSARTPETGEDEATTMMTRLSRWWDRVHFDSVLRLAIQRQQWGRRGVLVLRVPPSKLVNGALPTGKSPEDALDLIEVDCPLPADAGVVKAPDESSVAIVKLAKVDDTQDQRFLTWRVEGDTTIARVIGDAANTQAPETRHAMRGRVPVVEMRGDLLVTPPVIRMQALLNFITTVIGRVVETAGYAQTYTGNAEKEGIWTLEKPASPPLKETDWAGQHWFLRAIPRTVGSGVQVDLVGLEQPVVDARGTVVGKTNLTPTIERFEPVDPAFATGAAERVRARLFKMMHQGHLAGTATAEASGEAYEQARAQFESYLNDLRHLVEALIRDTLEALLALGGLMAPELGAFLDRFRLQATIRVDTGPLTAAEQQNIIALRDARIISQATAMARARVEDAQAEMDAILADPSVQADVSLKQAQTYSAWIQNTSEAIAGWLTGLRPDQVTALQTGELPAEAIRAGYPKPPPEPPPEADQPPVDPNAPAPGDNAAPNAGPRLSAA
jgi:hypothetical protein